MLLTDDQGIPRRTGRWRVRQSEKICGEVEDIANDNVEDCDDSECHQGA